MKKKKINNKKSSNKPIKFPHLSSSAYLITDQWNIATQHPFTNAATPLMCNLFYTIALLSVPTQYYIN